MKNDLESKKKIRNTLGDALIYFPNSPVGYDVSPTQCSQVEPTCGPPTSPLASRAPGLHHLYSLLLRHHACCKSKQRDELAEAT